MHSSRTLFSLTFYFITIWPAAHCRAWWAQLCWEDVQQCRPMCDCQHHLGWWVLSHNRARCWRILWIAAIIVWLKSRRLGAILFLSLFSLQSLLLTLMCLLLMLSLVWCHTFLRMQAWVIYFSHLYKVKWFVSGLSEKISANLLDLKYLNI